MKMVFGISEREVLKADVAEQLAAAKMIHFVMQDIITQKFLELNPNRPEEVEKEKSAFDEYDEENGYNEAENQLDDENIWKVCRDNVDRVVKLCIKGAERFTFKCYEVGYYEPFGSCGVRDQDHQREVMKGTCIYGAGINQDRCFNVRISGSNEGGGRKV